MQMPICAEAPRKAKTHQWTREALLRSPGALRAPGPRWSFCCGAQTSLGALAPANTKHQQRLLLSPHQPTNELTSLSASIRCAAWLPPACKWSHRARAGKKTPRGGTLRAVPAQASEPGSLPTQPHRNTPASLLPETQIPWQPAPFPLRLL